MRLWTLCPIWSVFINLPPLQLSSGDILKEIANSQKLGRGSLKFCLLGKTWFVHSWTHSIFFCLNKNSEETIQILTLIWRYSQDSILYSFFWGWIIHFEGVANGRLQSHNGWLIPIHIQAALINYRKRRRNDK